MTVFANEHRDIDHLPSVDDLLIKEAQYVFQNEAIDGFIAVT
jgi:hypothetical protein